MSMVKCLIVDDEVPAVQLLEKYAGMIPQLEVVGISHSALHAFDMLEKIHVDLMYLDIRMPVLNGIDFLKSLKDPPTIILTTAYREYALEGYDLDIVDYLLKPIEFSRFLKAFDRYRAKRIVPLHKPVEMMSEKDHIFFKVNRTNHKILFKDICYIESLKDYVRIHLENERLVVKGNLGSIMKQLPSDQFVRIHRSFAISIARIQSYNQNQVVVGGKVLPIGGSYRTLIALS